MGNVCEGQLKIRGKGQDIFKFFKECMKGVRNTLDEEGWYVPVWVDFDKYEKDILSNGDFEHYKLDTEYNKIKDIDHTRFYIKENNNLVINENFGLIKFFCCEMEDEIIKSLYISCDHSMEVDGLIELSEKYNLDFRFYGFNSADTFNQEVEIIKGIIAKDEIIEYEDYNWESPFNDIGG